MLLAVDPDIEKRRDQLKKDQHSLSKGLQWVKSTKKDEQCYEDDVTMHNT